MRAGPVRSLVIGIGNPLRGDDGIAWRLVARLPSQAGLAVRCRQQLTPEMAADLAAVDRLLVIDAWVGPGERAPLQLQELAAPGALPQVGAVAETWAGAAPWGGASHGISPQALLALSQTLFGQAPRAQQLLLPAHSFGHGEDISPALAGRLGEARGLIAGWIAVGPALQGGGHA